MKTEKFGQKRVQGNAEHLQVLHQMKRGTKQAIITGRTKVSEGLLI